MTRRIEDELEQLRSASLYRALREVSGPQGVEIGIDGRRLLNFSSNDYLGLASDPLLRDAAHAAIDQYGTGSGASRLICGTQTPHLELERRLATFKGTGAALTFSSGYATAVGTIGALLNASDVIILDKLSHASLIDGARLSGATIRVFPHNHMGKLESHLDWAHEFQPDARVLIVTESVFSMDGDRAPLAELVEIKRRHGAMLLLDEAHAVGVIGTHGRGLADRLGVAQHVDVQMGTLSKALGVSGGYICGSRPLIDLVINRARSFIYSTAPSPVTAATAEAAVAFLGSEEGERRRLKLRGNLELLASLLPEDFGVTKIQSAIVPLIIGGEDAALDAAKLLRERGCFVPAIRYPTVARGTARLRVTLSAAHSAEHIAALGLALGEVLPMMRSAV
jgi:8-amino-7-oxononanoate synthase